MKKRKNKRPTKPWTPFELYDLSNSRYAALPNIVNVYQNSRYIVQVYNPNPTMEAVQRGSWPHMLWLSIKTHERAPVRDWRDMMRIKNELAGTACESVELYPNEGRLVDTSNQFHQWVFPPGLVLPFGYPFRDVMTPNELRRHERGNGTPDETRAIQSGFELHTQPGCAKNECPEVGPIWADAGFDNSWYAPQPIPEEMPTFKEYENV